MRSLLPAVLACAVNLALGMYFDQAELSPSRSSCRLIPPSLKLCRGIEYPRMRLPNLLGHETMIEAAQQAAVWVPLVHKRCHADTRKFLCSLFAPVCLADLDEPIQPCRSLCEGVRSACAPVMAAFGFPWPDMLDCARFPQDNDLCIPPADTDTDIDTDITVPITQGVPKVCDACRDKTEDENEIISSLCKNDFVLQIKVKEISYMDGDTKIIPETKSKTVYKLSGVTERELKKAPLWLRDGLACMCDEMSNINATYLVMGQNLDGNLVITSLKRWQKGQREIKRLYRSIRKLQC